jgi:hypothetical protein
MGTAVQNFEQQLVKLTFALQLYDGFTGGVRLQGNVTVQAPNREVAIVKPDVGQFLFYTLGAGAQLIEVVPDPATAYYVPATLNITLPMSTPLWPAYPDRALANPALPLDDPGQPVAYRNQLAHATLRPAIAYPFPGTASLVRGTVRTGGVPLAGASVQAVGGNQLYLTAADGQYVLFFSSVAGTGDPVTLQVSHPLHATVNAAVTVRRSTTVTQDFVMA